MALAKKCDRCGKLYEHYPAGKKSQANAIRRVCKYASGYMDRQDDALDLCPECMSAFDEFMIRGKFGDEQ